MEAAIRNVVEAIHGSPTQAVLYIAGGASQALGWLMSVPRASNTILEAVVPYSRISMLQMFGKTPYHFVSQQTAEDLGIAAYNRALKLSMPGTPVAGISFTGSLVSDSPKRGDHRCHLCSRTRESLKHYKVSLFKGLRDRFEEDQVTSRILLKVVADACNVSLSFPLQLTENENMEEFVTSFNEEEQIRQLLSGQICMLPYAYSAGTSDKEARRVVLPGSFNPLHEGHIKLLDVASSLTSGAVPCFELSVINADKPPLTMEQIKSRAKQFKEYEKTVVFTNQPYFYKKAELFPNSTFVIGIDTAVRLINTKYYEGSQKRMLEVLFGVQQLGCDFLVAGRKIDGKFHVLADFSIPKEIEGLFKAVPEELFRADISSTEIRNKKQQGS